MPEPAEQRQEQPQERPPLRELFTDAMTTSSGDAEARLRAEAEMRRRANALLLGAITAGDAAMFEHAVKEKADVNFDRGKPLETAALNNSPLMLRLLVTNGADIRHAVKRMEEEQAAIPRKQRYRDSYYQTGAYYAYRSKEEERRWKQLNAAVKTLNEYEKVYLEKIAPLEAVRLQKQVLDELRALKEDIGVALHGKPVDKPRLGAPRYPDRKR